jgi:hypothetical protein
MGKPDGHFGAENTIKSARRAVLKSIVGPYYLFLRICTWILPWVFLLVGAIRYDSLWIGAYVLIYMWFFFAFVSTYLAMRAKVGIERCSCETTAYQWAKWFVPRTVAHLGIMMLVLFFGGIIWFTLSGVLIYVAEAIFTLTILKQQGCNFENEIHRAPEKPMEPEEK